MLESDSISLAGRLSQRLVRLAREPLLHFLIAGGLLFAAYAWLNRGSPETPRIVHISVAEVNWLKETWARQWQRPPTEVELRGLVTGYLKEVLHAREAAEMGLDENDTVIRRRLAQKMEFLVQDTARLAEPGEAELRKHYAANQPIYQAPARASFTQIFFQTEAAAKKGLAELPVRGPDRLGDPSLLEREHTNADAQAITSQFGKGFSHEIFDLGIGQWHGPVNSAYGYHLVHISARQDAQPRPFEEVRAQVLEDWQREQQAQASVRFHEALLKKYDVVVDESVRPLLGPLTEAR